MVLKAVENQKNVMTVDWRVIHFFEEKPLSFVRICDEWCIFLLKTKMFSQCYRFYKLIYLYVDWPKGSTCICKFVR